MILTTLTTDNISNYHRYFVIDNTSSNDNLMNDISFDLESDRISYDL